jgi:hypothetical protein
VQIPRPADARYSLFTRIHVFDASCVVYRVPRSFLRGCPARLVPGPKDIPTCATQLHTYHARRGFWSWINLYFHPPQTRSQFFPFPFLFLFACPFFPRADRLQSDVMFPFPPLRPVPTAAREEYLRQLRSAKGQNSPSPKVAVPEIPKVVAPQSFK